MTSSYGRPDWDGPLNEPEQSLVEHAAIGDLLDLGGGVTLNDDQPPIVESMQTWRPDRFIRAHVLRHLLVASEWPVHAKGVRVRGARISGPLDLESATLRCPLILEDCYFDSDVPLVLDYASVSLLKFVRCHLPGVTADMLVVTKGLDLERSIFNGSVKLHAADIGGELNFRGALIAGVEKSAYALVADQVSVGGAVFLDKGFSTRGAVSFSGASIAGQFNCRGAKIAGTDTRGNALAADRVTFGGAVYLDGGFRADGAVQLTGADINGELRCGGAAITRADHDGYALVADQVTVGGAVFLDRGFSARGAVSLTGASITGWLSCRDAAIVGADPDGYALVARGVKVGDAVFLDEGFTAAGAVRLSGADIAGQLRCSGAQITSSNRSGYALVADQVRVGGAVFLDEGFTAAGAVRLSGADIAVQLRCSSAKIARADMDGSALVADTVRVRGHVFLDHGFDSTGAILLSDARIEGSIFLRAMTLSGSVAFWAEGARFDGSLVWAPGKPVFGLVNLERAQAHLLEDDWSFDGAYWPPAGSLRLGGFVYDGFGGDHQATRQQRLDWVRRQHGEPLQGQHARFDTQPYDQVASAYVQAGQDSQARRIAIARRSDQRAYMSRNWLVRAGNRMLDSTVRSGEPLRVLGMLLAVYISAFLVFGLAQHFAGVMVPAQNTTFLSPVPTAAVCSSDYECFYPAGYAIDLAIPIVNVGQADNWRPDGSAPWGSFFVGLAWIFTGLGWAFTTLAVAFYTGFVSRD